LILLLVGEKHSGRFLPIFWSCNKSSMFLEALISLSIQHNGEFKAAPLRGADLNSIFDARISFADSESNEHSLELQRITLLI